MAVKWQALLQFDPNPWLLEPENPAVRHWALIDLLNMPGDAPDVQSAWFEIASCSMSSLRWCTRRLDPLPRWLGDTADDDFML